MAATSTKTPAKRGPGRPPKGGYPKLIPPSPVAIDQPIKRGPGRPRMHQEASATGFGSTPPTAPVPARKVVNLLPLTDGKVVKRGRGRPPKRVGLLERENVIDQLISATEAKDERNDEEGRAGDGNGTHAEGENDDSMHMISKDRPLDENHEPDEALPNPPADAIKLDCAKQTIVASWTETVNGGEMVVEKIWLPYIGGHPGDGEFEILRFWARNSTGGIPGGVASRREKLAVAGGQNSLGKISEGDRGCENAEGVEGGSVGLPQEALGTLQNLGGSKGPYELLVDVDESFKDTPEAADVAKARTISWLGSHSMLGL